MRTVYDELIQQKQKEMSKTLSDIAFKYPNPETKAPTVVPAAHFEKELGQLIEKTISESVNRQFLTVMYGNLNELRKGNEQLFYQALICMDNNLNPKDLRIPEQIAINHTYDYIRDKQRVEKKEFHFFNQDISNEYKRAITDPDIQAEAMEISNLLENQENRELNRIKNQMEQQFTSHENNNSFGNESHSIDDEHDDYDRDF